MRFYTFLLVLLVSSFTYLNAQCFKSNSPGIHIIQQGENLYRISLKYNISVDEICEWNNMTINQTLIRCSELKVSAPSYAQNNIPQEYNNTIAPPQNFAPTSFNAPNISNYKKQGGNRHTVQTGETLAGLAALYGYTEARFREFNAMESLDRITPGSILFSSDCSCARLSYNDPTSYGYEGSISNNNFNNNTTPTNNNNNTNSNNNKFTLPIRNQPNNTNINNRRPQDIVNNTSSSPNAKATYMTNVELSMVDEINLLRSNPSAYVQHVQNYVRDQKNNNGFPINQSAVDELIRELYNTPTLSTLVPTPCIYRAAKKHGQDILRRGKSGHNGSDGSWPWDRVRRECAQMDNGNENLVGGPETVRESVIILLIDDGIPTRGHRKTLLKPEWQYVATYKIGQVGMMPNSWVQKFGSSKSNNTNPSNNNNTNSFNNSNNNNTSSNNNNNIFPSSKATASYMNSVELSMVDEINLLRSNPSAYVSYVQAYVTGQKNNNGFPINQTVVDELIRELRNTPRLSNLVPTPCIYRAAKKHGQDILQRGKSGHNGSDGSWPWDRVRRECAQMTEGNENLVGGPETVRESVIILLIDDGIPTRGHRKTLLKPEWQYVATYKIGKVGYMPNSWVQKFGH